jgi:hypothetical protein
MTKITVYSLCFLIIAVRIVKRTKKQLEIDVLMTLFQEPMEYMYEPVDPNPINSDWFSEISQKLPFVCNLSNNIISGTGEYMYEPVDPNPINSDWFSEISGSCSLYVTYIWL